MNVDTSTCTVSHLQSIGEESAGEVSGISLESCGENSDESKGAVLQEASTELASVGGEIPHTGARVSDLEHCVDDLSVEPRAVLRRIGSGEMSQVVLLRALSRGDQRLNLQLVGCLLTEERIGSGTVQRDAEVKGDQIVLTRPEALGVSLDRFGVGYSEGTVKFQISASGRVIYGAVGYRVDSGLNGLQNSVIVVCARGISARSYSVKHGVELTLGNGADKAKA